jgi:hypothetical protein
MKRIFVLGLVVVSVAAASAAATPPNTTPPSPQKLSGFVCHRALQPAGRLVSVRAVMRPVSGTMKMSVRFELLSKPSSATTFSEVRGGDLGTWISPSDPQTLGTQPHDVWIVSHPVDNLPAPATYRFRVMFRWTAAGGKVLATHTLLSAKCFQPELRPDLLVQSITVEPVPGTPQQAEYVVVIRNAGASAAGPFQVVFAPGGSAPSKTHTIERLPAHTSREETFIGPVCSPTAPPTVTVDPGDHAHDLNPSNNSLTATCPAAQ